MAEFRTIVSCAKPLEIAFRSLDRDLVHFLHQEGFITVEVHDEVLSPRSMWTAHQKAGELVIGIRNKVKVSAQSYHTLLEHLQQDGKLYEGIVKILEEEYSRRQAEVWPATPHLSSTLTSYNAYLKDIYSNHYVASDDKLSIAPCSQFISLALIKKKSGDILDTFSRSTFHGGVDQIVAHKTPLTMDALLLPSSRFVLVEGPPGIGKSTLCWELCRKWDALKSLQRFKIVLLLKLRERRVQNASELNEIFFHRNKRLCQSVVDEVFECEGEGVLLVLDGFDEMPASIVKDKSSLIMELLIGTCLTKAIRLVTSRPSALHIKKVLPKNHRHVEILGFTDERKIEFADIAFQSEPDAVQHFKTFVFSNPIINSLMYIPVNCAIITEVYEDIRKSKKLMPKTMTQLYTTLVLVLIRRHMIETKKWPEEAGIPDSLESLPEDVLTDLRRIGKLVQRRGIRQVTFSDKDVGDGFQHLGLLCETKEMHVREGAKSSYAFLHLSLQEFIWAWHLSCSPDFDAFSVLPFVGFSVGRFIAGFLGCAVFSLNDLTANFVVQYLYEEQRCCAGLKDQVVSEKDFHCFSSWDLYTFGYVLAHAPLKWKLHLEEYSDMTQLVSCLRDCKKILGIITKLDIRRSWSLNKIEELPFEFFQHIRELEIEFPASGAAPMAWMSSLSNLEALSLNGICSPEDAPVLYQAIRSLPKLKKFCFFFSVKEAIIDLGQLPDCIAGLSLEYFHVVNFYHHDKDRDNESLLDAVRDLRRLVEAALSCPSLKTFISNVPFRLPNKGLGILEDVSFCYPGCSSLWPPELVQSCFLSVAEMCQMPSMRSLELVCGGSNQAVFKEFLTVLNKSLNRNPSFKQLKFDLNFTSGHGGYDLQAMHPLVREALLPYT